MIISSLNARLGPKTITAEGQVQKIAEIVKKKTGKEYIEIKREIPKKIRKKRAPKLPMRQDAEQMKKGYTTQHDILRKHERNIQLFDKALSKIGNQDKIKGIKAEKKSSQKVYKPFKVKKYKKKPLTRRLERNMMLFTEIFIEPERKRIEKLKEKEKDFTNLVRNVVNDQYDKILNHKFKKKKTDNSKARKEIGRRKRPMSSVSRTTAAINNVQKRTKNLRLLSATTKRQKKKHRLLSSKPIRNIQSAYPGSRLARQVTFKQKSVEREIDQIFNDSGIKEVEEDEPSLSNVEKDEFFDMPIFLQLPDLPNSTIASTLTPGQGWAPSLPLLSRLDFSPSEVKDLMLRAKSGLKIGDQQKEAHLLFYMGIVSENKQDYKKSCGYFKRFFKFAKNMQDKVGMTFALNRIGIAYYFLEKYKLAINFNKRCLEMIDGDNEYSVLYNMGICFRKLKDYFESLRFFEKALIWAKTRQDQESECLIFGQMALTYNKSGDEARALEYYQRCKTLSSRVNNLKLELDCLVKALDIREAISVRTNRASIAPKVQEYFSAIDAAESINDTKIKSKCKIDLGVIEGQKTFVKFTSKLKRDIQAGKIRELEEELNEDEDIITEYI